MVDSRYDVFLSYSHDSDESTAIALEAGLRHIGVARWGRPKLNVFRDENALPPSSGLWTVLVEALERSDHLFLLASPASAASSWVGKELAWWLENKRLDSLFIVALSRDYYWDPAKGSFDPLLSTALHPVLHGAFSEEPFIGHIEVCDDDRSARRSWRRDHRSSLAGLAATPRKLTKPELLQLDQHFQRRNRQFLVGAIVSLVGLVVGLTLTTWIALGALNDARQQRNQALARINALAAVDVAHENPALAQALAARSASLTELPSQEAYTAAYLARNAQGRRSAQQMGPPLLGHFTWVTSVAFSPDGRYLASGGLDDSVVVWNVETHQQVGPRLLGHNDRIDSLAWSPDGGLLATGSQDRTIRVWDTSTGEQLIEPLSVESRLELVSFSPDGTLIAAALFDNSILLWYADTGQSAGEPLRGHESAVAAVAWSPDSSRLASADGQPTVYVWDVTTGAVLEGPMVPDESFGITRSLTFVDGDTLRLVSSFDQRVEVWDIRDGKFAPDGSLRTSIADYRMLEHPSGDRIVIANSDNSFEIWSWTTGEPIGDPVFGHESELSSFSWSPNGWLLASGGFDGTVRFWDTRPSRSQGVLVERDEDPIDALDWAHPYGDVLVRGGWDGEIQLWDPLTRRPLLPAFIVGTGRVVDLALAPSTDLIAATDENDTLRVWDWSSGSNKADEILRIDGVDEVEWHPDGRRLAVRLDDSTVQILNTNFAGAPLATLSSGEATSIKWSSDGSRLAIGYEDGSVETFDEDLKPTRTTRLLGHRSSVRRLEFDPTDNWLASSSRDAIRLWDLTDDETPGQILFGPKSSVGSMQWSNDGRYLAAGFLDDEVIIWEQAETKWRIGSILSHGGSVNALAWSPDGEVLVTGDDQGFVRAWDANNGTMLGSEALVHTSNVTDLQWAAGGSTFATGSLDGTLRIWDPWWDFKSACQLATPYLAPEQIIEVTGVNEGLLCANDTLYSGSAGGSN